MAARELPARPSLEQYKKQAKELLKKLRSADPDALERARQYHPRLSRRPASGFATAKIALADAQLVIAREHAFDSWKKFARHIEAAAGELPPAAVWKLAENAVLTGDATMLERLLRDHEPALRKDPRSSWLGDLTRDGLGIPYRTDSAPDARSIIAAKHHFDGWDQFAAYTKALNDRHSAVAQFESAADAVVAGDVTTLERLLRQNQELIRARSTRTHHSTLLHYVGANGVEGFRQRTPKNAVQIAERLLNAGAEVDAVADMYRGTTTLGLVATSVHPAHAGVQGALIDLLLAHGASVDRAVADDYTDGHLVSACLVNGRPEAAEFLVSRGAPLDLEGAAGVGRLDIVRSFFNADGSLKSTATIESMTRGFARACDYGRTDVVEFLVDRGIGVGARLPDQGIFHGHTAVHLAALGGHVETIKALLRRHAPVDATDETFGTTATMWALYAWGEEPKAPSERYYSVVELLVDAGAKVEPEWLEHEKVRADPKMRAALSRKRVG